MPTCPAHLLNLSLEFPTFPLPDSFFLSHGGDSQQHLAAACITSQHHTKVCFKDQLCASIKALSVKNMQ